jgi:hypothetical protein
MASGISAAWRMRATWRASRPVPCSICWRHDVPSATISVFGRGAHRRQQRQFRHLHRHLVGFGLIAEGARHAAAARLHRLDLEPGHQPQRLFHRPHGVERLLVAMAMQQGLARRGAQTQATAARRRPRPPGTPRTACARPATVCAAPPGSMTGIRRASPRGSSARGRRSRCRARHGAGRRRAAGGPHGAPPRRGRRPGTCARSTSGRSPAGLGSITR